MFKKKLSSVFIYVSVLLLVGHLLYWRQYSFKSVVFQSAFVLTQKTENLYGLVGICNKLKHFSCSHFLLKHLLNQYPGDSLALFNLAYVEYKKNHWQLSEAYLKNYLSLKEDNIEAYLLYSKVLQKLNKKQESLDVLYGAFSKKRDARLIPFLVIALNLNNHSTEALSLLFSINNSFLKTNINFNNQKNNFLQEKEKNLNFRSYDSLPKLLAFSEKRFAKNLFKHKKPPLSIRLFSVRGGGFFAPMRLKEIAKPKALQLIIGKKKEMINKISLSFLEENYVFLKEELKIGKEINLSKLFIGPWVMKNIKFQICENCVSQLYIQNLSEVSYKLTKKYIFHFLNVFFL